MERKSVFRKICMKLRDKHGKKKMNFPSLFMSKTNNANKLMPIYNRHLWYRYRKLHVRQMQWQISMGLRWKRSEKNKDDNDHDTSYTDTTTTTTMAKQNSKTIIKTTTKWITTRATKQPNTALVVVVVDNIQSVSPIVWNSNNSWKFNIYSCYFAAAAAAAWYTYVSECVCTRFSMYECVVICVHFPRFYGKPRCTHTLY